MLTATTADAYVRRTVGGGHVVRGAGAYSGRYVGGRYADGYYGRGYYGHPVARGAAVVAGAAAAGAATGWGWNWNQPYYGGNQPYYGGYGYDGGVYANRSYVTGRPTLIPRYYGGYAAGGYYGNPNNRGGLVGGSDSGTYRY